MKVFIAGIMQGSRQDQGIDDQDYRRIIAQSVQARYPHSTILDPNELHPNGSDYDDQKGKVTLLAMAELAGEADVLVAYAPQASMGTAIEMWQAFQAGVPVISISPMTANWVVRYLSQAVLPDLESFAEWIARGELDKLAHLE